MESLSETNLSAANSAGAHVEPGGPGIRGVWQTKTLPAPSAAGTYEANVSLAVGPLLFSNALKQILVATACFGQAGVISGNTCPPRAAPLIRNLGSDRRRTWSSSTSRISCTRISLPTR